MLLISKFVIHKHSVKKTYAYANCLKYRHVSTLNFTLFYLSKMIPEIFHFKCINNKQFDLYVAVFEIKPCNMAKTWQKNDQNMAKIWPKHGQNMAFSI